MAGVGLLAPGLGQLGVAGALGLELLLELGQPDADPAGIGGALVELGGDGVVARDLGAMGGLRLRRPARRRGASRRSGS